MINILSFYYQIIINEYDIDNKGYFHYNNHLFYLCKYERDIN